MVGEVLEHGVGAVAVGRHARGDVGLENMQKLIFVRVFFNNNTVNYGGHHAYALHCLYTVQLLA